MKGRFEMPTPPASEGEVPSEEAGEKEDKGFLRRLAEMADRKLQAFVLAVGLLAGEGKAFAEPGKKPAAAARQEKLEKRSGVRQVVKELPGGRITFLQADPEPFIHHGKRAGTAVASRLDLEEKKKGGTLKITEKMYRADLDDGGRQWVEDMNVTGAIGPEDDLFGRVEGFPASFKGEGMDAGLARDQANIELKRFGMELKVIRAMREIGRGDGPEAVRLLEQLRRHVRKFQEGHPDVALAAGPLKEIFEEKR